MTAPASDERAALPTDLDGAAALDAWAVAAFEGLAGAAVLAPWLQRWRDEVGELRGADADFEALAAARTDWALVDMGAGMPVIGLDPTWPILARSWVGLFEVWPTDGGPAWLRDRLGGACMPLRGPIDLRRESEGPAALWELRGIVDGGALVPCRPPVVYPPEVLAVWPMRHAMPDPRRPMRTLQALRSARLRHARMPRMDPRPIFAAALRSAETIVTA